MSSLPFLADLEANLKSCETAIGAIIDIQKADDNEQRLTALVDALGEVRSIQICLADWIGNAKEAGYPGGPS